MFRTHVLTLSAALLLALGVGRTCSASLFWVGTASNASTAGGGTWNNTTPAAWSTTSGGAANSDWAAFGDAVFQGTAGGTVTTGANLNINSITLSSGAGAFIFSNSWDLEISGAGVTDNASSSQSFSNSDLIDFNNSASASAGSSSASYSGFGTINFNNSSTAGNASITNSGLLTFNNTSSGGTASVNNQGDLDISGLSSSGLSLGSLDNSASVVLGTGAGGVGKTMTLSSLTVEGGAEFDFTLGTTSSRLTATTLTDNTSGNPATIDIESGSGFGAGSYILIADTGGTLTLADYTLGTAPAGYKLQLAASGHDLDFVSVPEPGSVIPALSALAVIFCLFRRQ